LINWEKEFRDAISNLKALELERLYEEYFLTTEQKIRLFGKQVKAITEVLEKRDFEDLSTKQLLELLHTYYQILDSNKVELIFHTEEEIVERKRALKRIADIIRD